MVREVCDDSLLRCLEVHLKNQMRGIQYEWFPLLFAHGPDFFKEVVKTAVESLRLPEGMGEIMMALLKVVHEHRVNYLVLQPTRLTNRDVLCSTYVSSLTESQVLDIVRDACKTGLFCFEDAGVLFRIGMTEKGWKKLQEYAAGVVKQDPGSAVTADSSSEPAPAAVDPVRELLRASKKPGQPKKPGSHMSLVPSATA